MLFSHEILALLMNEAGDDAGGGAADPGSEISNDAGGEPEIIPLAEEDPVEPGEAGADNAGAASAAAAAAAGFTPNFKYKVKDTEKEVPPWAREHVKDEATQKEVLDLFSAAEGLPEIKAAREAAMTERNQARGELTTLRSHIGTLTGLVQKGDLQTFFEALQIPERAVFEYAHKRLQLLQDPALAAQHEAQRAQQATLASLESENARLRGMADNSSVSSRTNDLDINMAKPEVMSIATAFDARMGRQGAFREEVIRRGQLHAFQGRDISAEQATKEVVALIGGAAGPLAPGGQPGQAGANPGANGQGNGAAGQPLSVVPQAPAKKPVIPNISGNGMSPAQVVPKSIKQLRELGQQAAAQGR